MKTWEKAKQALKESLGPEFNRPRKLIKLTYDSPYNPGFEMTEYYKTIEEAAKGISRHTPNDGHVCLEWESIP